MNVLTPPQSTGQLTAEPQKQKVRYHLLDSLRGLTLLSMMLYHAVWDLVYIFGMDWQWYRGTAAYLWQQCVCWTFILLSGFCWSMGRKPFKRGLIVLGASILLSLVTLVFMPNERVVFGVLTFLGSAMLLMIPLDKLLVRLNPIVGFAASGLLFALTRHVARGTAAFGVISLPMGLYDSYLLAYLGFPPPYFWSTDYFPLIPWFFLFLAGYFLHKAVKDSLHKIANHQGSAFLNLLGRHSLLVYLLHQPILYGIFTLCIPNVG